MNQDNRTLGRKGARELTPEEAEVVIGAANLLTICTVSPPPFGDVDCGP